MPLHDAVEVNFKKGATTGKIKNHTNKNNTCDSNNKIIIIMIRLIKKVKYSLVLSFSRINTVFA